jgi:hypothetical protein
MSFRQDAIFMRFRCDCVVGNDNMPLFDWTKRSEKKKKRKKRKDANGIIVDTLVMGSVN